MRISKAKLFKHYDGVPDAFGEVHASYVEAGPIPTTLRQTFNSDLQIEEGIIPTSTFGGLVYSVPVKTGDVLVMQDKTPVEITSSTSFPGGYSIQGKIFEGAMEIKQ